MKKKSHYEINIVLGQRLKKIRTKKKMTQIGLGDIIGMKSSNIANIEQGRQGINFYNMTYVAKALKIGVIDLVSDKGTEDGSKDEEIATLKNEIKYLSTLTDGSEDIQALKHEIELLRFMVEKKIGYEEFERYINIIEKRKTKKLERAENEEKNK